MRTVGYGKKDANAAKMAAKALRLDEHLTRIRDEKDLEIKRGLAIAMAEVFEVGGRDNFIATIRSASTGQDIDRIAYNAALKGEGMSTKRFR